MKAREFLKQQSLTSTVVAQLAARFSSPPTRRPVKNHQIFFSSLFLLFLFIKFLTATRDTFQLHHISQCPIAVAVTFIYA
jgi:hypothetical protein